MASITRQNIGKYTYLYESVSYWDPVKKRPDNDKVRIGKIDLLTGEPVYKQEYLDRLAAAGVPTDGMRLWGEPGTAAGGPGVGNEALALSVIDSVRDFGVVYFLRKLSEKIGVLGILREALPAVWKEIFCLVCYLIANDKNVMYCEEWAESNDGLNVDSMCSQRTSDLFLSFGCAERNEFYRRWYALIREREYIALDISSISSYSGQIQSCEYGYNRDGENLPQVNVCMLLGEGSKLPVYQTLYSGSLRDVSTLKATLAEFAALTDAADLMVVIDKGFFSTENVGMLLGEDDGEQRYRFLISVPFTSKFAKSQVESAREDIDTIANVVLTSGAPIRGICKRGDWGDGRDINAHVFYNPEKAVKERNEMFGYVASLVKQAAADPDNVKLAAEYDKYLRVSKSKLAECGVTVSIREDVIAKELETVGWFVLISNHIDNPQDAHDTYRMKDVVEKGFHKLKNNLGLDRLRVHSDERMQNKVFVAFISLIIASAMHETMKRQNLYKKMTLERLILTLAKLKSATVNGKTILRPITKDQRDIFDAFGIAAPGADGKNPPAPKKRGRKPKSAPAAL